jgi:carbamoyltransferase
VLASVHQFLEDLLLERVTTKIWTWKGEGPWNLCFVGGCALNIKWNSALRAHPMFQAMWVPPFPNDSGSALGTATAHLVAMTGIQDITWHPRLGPAVKPTSSVPTGWQASPCSPAELARVLHETGKAVVVVNGRAELGPRALGGRSILAPATNLEMKDFLNRIKGRESFRPVAPVCLVEHAPGIFDPGTPDPHMLFDHRVRENWVDRIPAVLHVDGTARLQTVNREDAPALDAILREYHRLSGIPVLCNTSANYNGRGFFPDADSAMKWGRLDTVWSEGKIYRRQTQTSGAELENSV